MFTNKQTALLLLGTLVVVLLAFAAPRMIIRAQQGQEPVKAQSAPPVVAVPAQKENAPAVKMNTGAEQKASGVLPASAPVQIQPAAVRPAQALPGAVQPGTRALQPGVVPPASTDVKVGDQSSDDKDEAADTEENDSEEAAGQPDTDDVQEDDQNEADDGEKDDEEKDDDEDVAGQPDTDNAQEGSQGATSGGKP